MITSNYNYIILKSRVNVNHYIKKLQVYLIELLSWKIRAVSVSPCEMILP